MYGTDHAIYKRSGKFYIYPGHLSGTDEDTWPSSFRMYLLRHQSRHWFHCANHDHQTDAGKMQPAVTGLAEATGSSLSAIDVGGAATAVMGFGSSMGAIIIPLCVAVNIAMLVARLTDCVNVDVFNLHQNASMGAIVGVYSGSFLYGALTAALFHVWALIAADLGAKNNEKFFNLPKGVAISHPVANTYLLFAYPFNWIYDRIPGFRNLNVTAETIQKRFGILGDPTTVGFIIGILLGFCGYGWKSPYHTIIASLQLGMYLAAVMLLLPRMTSIMMEGLVPLSNVARKNWSNVSRIVKSLLEWTLP